MNALALLATVPYALLLFILPFPGTVALRLLCLTAAFLITLVSWRRLAPPALPAKGALAAWALVALLSLAYAVDPAYSLGEIKNEIGYSMMVFVAFFAVTRSWRQVQIWSLAVIASVVLISAWALALMQHTGAWQDGAGHGGVGSFASLAVICMPLLLLLLATSVRLNARLALAAAGVLLLFAAAASQQRILWMALGAQLALIAALAKYARIWKLSMTTLAAIVLASFTAAGAALLVVHAQKVDQSPAEYYDITHDFRLEHWAKVVERIQSRPWTGAGFGRESMKKAYPELVPTTPPMTLLWHPHNVFLTYGIGMGIPGMLALLLVFVSLFSAYARYLREAEARTRLLAMAGMAILAGVLVRNMTNDFFMRDGALLFWALNGGLLGYLFRQPARGTA